MDENDYAAYAAYAMNAMYGGYAAGAEEEVPKMVVSKKALKRLREEEKEKQGHKNYRMKVAGTEWTDKTLGDFPENDYRLYVANLSRETTDEMLARKFSHYKSFKMARTVRDKMTKKCKGYGFVSLMDPVDFTDAIREMNGQFCGSHPMIVKKSKWRENVVETKCPLEEAQKEAVKEKGKPAAKKVRRM